MSLRVLVVEDEEFWREALAEILSHLDKEAGEAKPVEVCESVLEAKQKIGEGAYDLIIVDLSLLEPATTLLEANEKGFELLQEIRGSEQNRHCAVIVVTGCATTDRIHRALQEFGVRRVILKNELEAEEDGDQFLLRQARSALLEARLSAAAARRASRYIFTLTFNRDGWIESELRGPAGRSQDSIQPPALLNTSNLARRADNINLLLLADRTYEGWREEVCDLGGNLYLSLTSAPRIYDKWMAAQTLIAKRTDLWMSFRGPIEGLGVPFDLLRDDKDYICLRSLVSREVSREGFSRKAQRFYEFVHHLTRQNLLLRILLVGSNADGTIPGAEQEAIQLASRIDSDLNRLGVGHEIRLLVHKEASYQEVRRELGENRYHIFHYAGHGRFDDTLPEVSGPVLRDGAGFRTLTANELGLIAADSGLQLVFLSCCLGARTARQAGRSDFFGIYDGLVRAGVPAIVGHRWVVRDDSALNFAAAFYSDLWRSFCPAEAVLHARRESAMGYWQRQDHAWASPMLLMRTE